MTKWKYVIEWFFGILILHYDCSAGKIDREVCLKTPFVFALGDKACGFTFEDAKKLLKAADVCLQKCSVKIMDLESSIYFYRKYELEFIKLTFNGKREDLTTITTGCDNIFDLPKRTMEIICKTDFDNAVDVSKDLCTSTTECEDVSKTCSQSSTIQIGVCTCRPGYIGFENKCLEGNLKLNATCERNEQCSGTFGSVCRNNTCVCRPGYAPLNDSECFLSSPDRNSQARILDQKEDNAVGVTVGSVLGGLILGVIVTFIVVIIYHYVRHGKPKSKEKGSPNVAFFNNTTYETETDMTQSIPAIQRKNEKKVVNVPPFAHSVELPVKRNFQEAKKRSMANNDINDDVYNHLNEKAKDSDIDENYDHAQGNPNHAMGESDYSNLSTGRRNKKSGVSSRSISEDNYYDVQEPPGDYCSLKKQ